MIYPCEGNRPAIFKSKEEERKFQEALGKMLEGVVEAADKAYNDARSDIRRKHVRPYRYF